MSLINLPPTRSNLLQLKSSLVFAREGYTILDKKREVLTMELLSMESRAEEQQQKVAGLVEKAYRALELAWLTMGREKVEWAAISVSNATEVDVINHGLMGVPLPSIESYGSPPMLTYSLADTMAFLDEANRAYKEVLVEIPLLASLEVSVRRIAAELKKTQRRVNALERIFIPNFEETIRFIQDNLEEQDREEVFRMQWLRDPDRK